MPKTEAPPAQWRDWDSADKLAQPKRTCSIAGCREAPTRARETTTPAGKSRTHVYCRRHAAENGG